MRRSIVYATVALLFSGCVTTVPPSTTTPKTAARHRHKVVAGPVQKETRPTVQLTTKDALGADVHIGPDEPVTVVFLATRHGKDELKELGHDVDEKLMDEPVRQVVIMDLRTVPSVLRGKANDRMRQAAEQSLDKRRARREQRHADASDDAVKRWHLVADYHGNDAKQLGVDDPPEDHAVVLVVDKDGRMSGPYQQADKVVAAVRRAEEQHLARAKRHKTTAKR